MSSPRPRSIDDRLSEALAAGVEQVVALGADYDARAFRFADVLGAQEVFELDHPATQARKEWVLRRIARRHAPPAVDVRRVPIDFEHASVARRPVAAGCEIAFDAWFLLDHPDLCSTWRTRGFRSRTQERAESRPFW